MPSVVKTPTKAVSAPRVGAYSWNEADLAVGAGYATVTGDPDTVSVSEDLILTECTGGTVPPGATPASVEVTFTRAAYPADGLSPVTTEEVCLVVGGSVVAASAQGDEDGWPSPGNAAPVTFTFAATNLTPAQLNAPGFGFAVAARLVGGEGTGIAPVAYVTDPKVKINY